MGAKGGATQRVVDYRMSLHIGICHGPIDSLRSISINEKVAWEAAFSDEGDISIIQPELFGGNKKEGGAVGTVTVLPGRSTQVMPELLAQKLGRTSATSPAFRGITTLFFHDGDQGFYWSSNNPVLAQTIDVEVRRKSVSPLDQDEAMIGADSNPAHMIFECLTNPDWGMGASTASISIPSFAACSATLYFEQFGLSMMWSKQAAIEDFVSEILDHIQGTLYLDPHTGLLTLKLLRDDYDIDTLRLISPDNADLSNFQRKMWGETANEIQVSWTNPANEQTEQVTVQDLGAIAAQGATISDSRDYYGIRNSDLAALVAARDLRTSSAPLATIEVLLDRSAWDIVPGEVVRVDWPEYQLYGLIMRAMKVDYGRPGEMSIKVNLMEDVFSLDRPLNAIAPPNASVPLGDDPAPMAHVEILTVPYFLTSSALLASSATEVVYPEVVAMIFGHQDSLDTATFELREDLPNAGGDVSMSLGGTKTRLDRITLSGPMPAAAVSLLPGIDVSNVLQGPQVGGLAFIGTGGDDMEVALVDSYDGFDWTLARGILDTVPYNWTAGTPVWFVNPGARITDTMMLRSAGETVEYKLLSRTSKGLLPEADAPIESATLTARPHLPLRPANVKVNGGTGFADVAIGASSFVNITWATRNRLLEDGQIVRWGAASVAPEYRQETLVSIYDQSLNLVYQQGALWTESGLSMPKTAFDRYSAIYVHVTSRRDDLVALQHRVIKVTGFANNPAAALPPAPPTPTLPPSPENGPSASDWTVVGTAITGADGSSVPTILVQGKTHDPDVKGLIIRYRRTTGPVDWVYHPDVALTQDVIVKVAISPLAPATAYIVEIAYQYGIISLFTSKGTVTTGASIASGVVDMPDLGDLDAQLDSIFDQLGLNQRDLHAINLTTLHQALTGFQDDIYRDGLDFLNGERLGPVILRVDQARQDGDVVLAQTMALIGAKSADGLSFILDLTTARVSPTETLATRFSTLSAASSSNAAAVTTEATARTTADSALAALITALTSTVTTNNTTLNSAITSEASTRASADSTLATTISTLSSTVTTNNTTLGAAITSEAGTRASADSALAGTISTLSSTVTGNYATLDASITSEAGTRATADSALAGTITTLSSTVTGNFTTLDASITSEASTRASADSAIAGTVSTLSSTVGGYSSTLTTYGTTLSDISGRLAASWGVILNTDGRVSGIKLQTVGGAGTTLTSIAFLVDSFLVYDPDSNSNIPMFEITNGVARIGGERVVTESIVDESIMVPVDAYTSGSLTPSDSSVETTLQSAAITSTGRKIQVMANFFAGVSDAGNFLRVMVYRDSTQIYSVDIDPILINSGSNRMISQLISVIFADRPSAGTYTYSLRAKTGVNGFSKVYRNRYLSLEERKK